jgi:hypothetical protein
MTTSNEAGFVSAVVFHCIEEVNVDLLVSVWSRGAEAYVVEDSISKDGCELQFFCFLPSLVTVFSSISTAWEWFRGTRCLNM